MDWFQAPDYWLSRLVLERGIASLYLVGFVVAANQFPALLGERGLLPAPRYLARSSFWRSPTLFHAHYSDRFLRAVAAAGALLSAALVLGAPQSGPAWVLMLAWFVVWCLYQSIVNVGQTFYAFGWESLLLEAGFLAIFLGPSRTAPPVLVIFLLRWLLFRVEFGAGLIKIRGDRCWRDLTCLDYHHETQPMPNPLSRTFHRLPRSLHRAEVVASHFTQLVVPFGLFAPQPVAGVAALCVIVTQAWLILSGNFAWLNWITLTLAVSALDDGWLRVVLPVHHGVLADPAEWFVAVVVAATALVGVLSWWPIRNLLSRRQLMNFSFNPFHVANTYGAFGSITRERFEVVFEGTDASQLSADTVWREYGFKGKPGDPTRRPPQVAPYHLRLDWLMWFAAMSPPVAHPWVFALAEKLLEADPATLRLLRHDPFGGRAPAYVRAELYLYRFASREERAQTGAWWTRTRVGEYLPPLRVEQSGRAA